MVLFLYGGDSHAVSTQFFKQSPFVGFDQGEKGNVSLVRDGIKLSPKINPIEGIEEPYVWCLTKDEYRNIYVGTGDPGSVYKLSPMGDLTLVYRFEELYVQSLAVSPNGHIFVGTSPQGIVYRITPWREAIMVCDLPDSYIWKLQFDETGRLYAATGPEGRIYRISENGDADIFFDSSQSHILDIALDRESNLYACSEPDGLIYKITPEGKAFVIYDADEDEVHGLTIDSMGNLYAGTASGARPQIPVTPPAPSIGPFPEPLPSMEAVPPVGINAQQQEIQPPPPPPRRPKVKPGLRPPIYGRVPQVDNFVYKITPDGVIKKVLTSQRGFIFDLCADEDDNIYVGTGNEAGLYKIYKDENVSTLLEVEEDQVLSLLFVEQKGLFLGTGNNGRLYELSQTYAQGGVFKSSIYDAGIDSSWGNISLDADVPEGTGLTIATRTGNSERPDNTWSKWSAEHGSGEKVESPPSRFIQYRASLSTTISSATPLLKSVSIAYLPNNQPPEIISLAVDGDRFLTPGREVWRGGAKSPAEPRDDGRGKVIAAPRKPTEVVRAPGPGTKHIEWQASDPNGDSMSFKLYYKGIREKNWKFLREETEKLSYIWQTTRVPDGEYLVKLVASDEPDNPPQVASNTEKISQPFLIDNTRPVLTNLSVSTVGHKKAAVEGSAIDELSNISKLQYSVDAGDWISIFPEDRIFDAREESFNFTIDGLTPGEHTVVINATDEEGNIGSGKTLIELPD